jgi:hypothetical protein
MYKFGISIYPAVVSEKNPTINTRVNYQTVREHPRNVFVSMSSSVVLYETRREMVTRTWRAVNWFQAVWSRAFGTVLCARRYLPRNIISSAHVRLREQSFRYLYLSAHTWWPHLLHRKMRFSFERVRPWFSQMFANVCTEVSGSVVRNGRHVSLGEPGKRSSNARWKLRVAGRAWINRLETFADRPIMRILTRRAHLRFPQYDAIIDGRASAAGDLKSQPFQVWPCRDAWRFYLACSRWNLVGNSRV